MNPEFEQCLKNQKIKEFSRGKALIGKELEAADSDLKQAKISIENRSYKWATVQSYYAMFHSARALLYAKNYREKSHYCLIIAIKALYTEKNLLPLYLIESLQKGKTLRESADYYDDWSEIGANEMLKNASEFIAKAKELLGINM
jgi:uncharacterized protein (UPF0332 family)